VAVKLVDKLQFLSFIFAVLLSITVPYIALTLEKAIKHQHTKILLKLVQIILRYHDFFDFQIEIGHYFTFLKLQNFIC